MIAFIDAHRDRFGVEPICRVLTEHGCKIAPNTYWVARKRPPSKRACRDAELVVEIRRVYAENLFVYGADKVWAQLNREGIRVARCTVERLMRAEGLSGARRGKAFKITTRADDRQQRPADLVERQFRAPAPNRLWVADLTYVKTHTGWVYVAFIIDVYSRMIVGWQASRSLRSDLAIDALGDGRVEPPTRRRTTSTGLVHHSDRGVQYLSVRYSERLADNDIVASVGSKGDSYDNALAESLQRALQVGAHLPAGTLARPRRRRVRHHDLRRLVQPPPPPRRDHRRRQLHHPGRSRSRLLPSDHHGRRGRHPIARAVTRPGALHLGTSANRLRAKCTRQRWWETRWKLRRSAPTRPAC